MKERKLDSSDILWLKMTIADCKEWGHKNVARMLEEKLDGILKDERE